MESSIIARDLVYLKETYKSKIIDLYNNDGVDSKFIDEGLSSFIKADWTNTKRRMEKGIGDAKNNIKYHGTNIPRVISTIPDIVKRYRDNNMLKHAANDYRKSAESYNRLRKLIGDSTPSRAQLNKLKKRKDIFTSASNNYVKKRNALNDKFKNVEWLGRVAGAEKSLQKKFGDGTGYNNPEGK